MNETESTSADASPAVAGQVERGVGHPQGSADNAQVLIVWAAGETKLWRAKKLPGCFGGFPDAIWGRTLEQIEVDMLLRDPWCMYEVPNDSLSRPQRPAQE